MELEIVTLIGSILLPAINFATEIFKTIVTENFNIPERWTGIVNQLFAVTVGLVIAFGVSGVDAALNQTFFAESLILGKVLLGFALGYGSKGTYYFVEFLRMKKREAEGDTIGL